MNNVISFLVVATLIFALGYKLYRLKKLRKIAQELLPDDDVVQDIVQEEDYNGSDLFIREEERVIWETMSRKDKRALMKKQLKAIQKGELVYIETEDGKRLITRAEARNNGLV